MNEFIEIVRTKKDLKNISRADLLSYLESLSTLNYYTGSCYKSIYDLNNMLSIKTYTLFIELEQGFKYLCYLKDYLEGYDIFIMDHLYKNKLYMDSYNELNIINEHIRSLDHDLLSYNEYIDLMDNITFYKDQKDLYNNFIDPIIIDSLITPLEYELKYKLHDLREFIDNFFDLEQYITSLKSTGELVYIRGSYIMDYN